MGGRLTVALRAELTAEEALRRVERRREIDREAARRYRLRRRMTRADDGGGVRMTPAPETAPRQDDAPAPPGPPVSLSISKEIEKIKTILAPFSRRGYEHDPAFWACMATRFPDVALEVEAYNVASWLKKGLKKNREAECSQGFLINWLKKAQADADAGKAARTQASSPANGVAKGVVVNGTWHPPAAFQRNPGPPPDEAVPLTGPLERIGEAELRAVRDANRHLTLAQKAARLTNGVHKS